MKGLLAGLAILISYGSLYPFANPPSGLDADAVVFASDVVGNMLMFLPWGLLSYLGARTPTAVDRRQLLLQLAAGVSLAAALQWAQDYIPTRDASWLDVLSNAAGMALGVVLGQQTYTRAMLRPVEERSRWLTKPGGLLVCLWLLCRFAPFVPVYSAEILEGHVKALARLPVDLFSFLSLTVAWGLVLSYLRDVDGGHTRAGAYLLLALVVQGLSGLMLYRPWAAHEFLAAIGGWLLALYLPPRWRLTLYCPAIYAIVLWNGLRPFLPSSDVRPFYWQPFWVMINSDMSIALRSLSQKLFWYGALLWVTQQSVQRKKMPWLSAAVMSAICLASIEFAQRHLMWHTAESTDPLLALLLAYLFMQWQQYWSRQIESQGKNSTVRAR